MKRYAKSTLEAMSELDFATDVLHHESIGKDPDKPVSIKLADTISMLDILAQATLPYRFVMEYFHTYEKAQPTIPLAAYITFSAASFPGENKTTEARTFLLLSSCPGFQEYKSFTDPGPIYGTSLDGAFSDYRLDLVMACHGGGPTGWRVEQCMLAAPPMKGGYAWQ